MACYKIIIHRIDLLQLIKQSFLKLTEFTVISQAFQTQLSPQINLIFPYSFKLNFLIFTSYCILLILFFHQILQMLFPSKYKSQNQNINLHSLIQQMNKGAQSIDYHQYAIFMRKALSGPQICNQDGTLNHLYFNTKKGFYWSEQHNQLLRQGLSKYGLDWQKIKQEIFYNTKTEVQIQLRACLLLGVKDSSKITDNELNQIRKPNSKVNGNHSSKKK